MTDNAFAYVKNRSLRELLTAREIRHLTTQPYRPRTNATSSASTKPWAANGPTAAATPPASTEPTS